MNKQIIEEAAEWFVEFNADAPDLATRKRFDKWLRASPEHVRAFLELVPIWEDATQLVLDEHASAEQLIQRARASNNVVRMPAEARPAAAGPERARGRHLLRPLLAASIVVALIAVAGVFKYRELRYPTYTTGTGEQRSLVLSDSSTVELNTRSKIRIHYSEHERAIELVQGQALFHVAKSAERPFVVYSGDTRVLAVGTRFDVYKKPAGVVVTVVEGRVAVYSDPDDRAAVANIAQELHRVVEQGDSQTGRVKLEGLPESMLLAAGEQLTVSSQTGGQLEHPSLAGATAWTQRQLVFESAPLADVAAEFNRYNNRRLSIDAALLDDFQVSGIFSSTDPSSLVRFLRAQPGISVVESDNEIRVSPR